MVLIFGRPRSLWGLWAPIFDDHFNKSQVRWHIDDKMFSVQRHPRRDRHTNNATVWHSMNEDVLTVVRKTAGTRKKAGILPRTRKYTEAFKTKYGPVSGVPGNVYANYEPPSLSSRLRDQHGNVLRKNAEKTPALCEYFLDLLSSPQDLVVDLFAGTASMGLACIKADRKYYGSEPVPTVCTAAKLRLAKLLKLKERGDFAASLAEPGLTDTVVKQVMKTNKNLCISK